MAEEIEQLRALGVTTINDLRIGQEGDVYAVIRQSRPVKPTRGPDYSLVINITDPSLGWEAKGMGINMFYPDAEAFPSGTNPGDIVVLKKIDIKGYNSNKQGVTHKGKSSWTFFDQKTLNPRLTPNMEKRCTMDENDEEIVRILHQWQRSVRAAEIDDIMELDEQQLDAAIAAAADKANEAADPENPPTMYGGGKRPILTTAQIANHSSFLDYIGMVIACNRKMDRVELLLTDFTENKRHMDGFTADGTIDPKLIIQGTLWDEHARGCPELNRYDIVHMRNLVPKTSKQGYLEIVLRGEKNTPAGFGKCKIKKFDEPNHPYVRAIELRKARFFERQSPTSNKSTSVVPQKVVTVISDNVRKVSDIDEILQDETAVQKYRIRARIVDYKPQDPINWVHKICDNCQHTSPYTARSCQHCGEPVVRYGYKAALLAEDADGNQIFLLIYGDDPEHTLFKDYPPSEPTELYIKGLTKRLLQLRPENNYKAWVDLGVASYRIDGPQHRYQIYKTQFQVMS